MKNFNSILVSTFVQLSLHLPGAAEIVRQQSVVLYRDQIIEFPLTAQASSVIVANPEIADIVTQSATSIVLVGRKTGLTNLLIRDTQDRSLIDLSIDVRSTHGQDVTLYYGSIHQDYSCKNECRKINSPNDLDKQINGEINPVKSN